jgi:hypothetical protein
LWHLYGWVDSTGRLIIGSYGSRSRNLAPADVASTLVDCGFEVIGSSNGGGGPITQFAWVGRT